MANEGKVYKVWLIMECEYITEDPKDGLYLPKVWKVRQQAVGQFIKKAIIFMARLSGTAALTYLYSVKAIESAFLDRGYVAYGGEYLMIPFVFYAVFKVLGGIGVLCSGIFQKKEERRW